MTADDTRTLEAENCNWTYEPLAVRDPRTPHRDQRQSGPPEKPQVEGSEHQNNADIHHQPFPEPGPEERDIDTDDDGDHRRQVKHDSDLSAHVGTFGYGVSALGLRQQHATHAASCHHFRVRAFAYSVARLAGARKARTLEDLT
jgi:hypothetical protein